jgi:hypothetical protein
MLKTTVYIPELLNVILPVLVPVPLIGDAPALGTTLHCTFVLGIPPLKLKLAVLPTRIAALLGLTLAVLLLGVGHAPGGDSTKNLLLAVA